MAPLLYFRRKVLLLCLVFCSLLLISFPCLLCAFSSSSSLHHCNNQSLVGSKSLLLIKSRRMLLGLDVVEDQAEELTKPKKKSSNNLSTTKSQTNKLMKPNSSFTNKNQTKVSTSTKITSSLSNKSNQTKISVKATTNSTKSATLLTDKLNSTSSKLKKLNSTSLKNSNSTKTNSLSSTKKASSDLIKPGASPKSKTTKPTTTTHDEDSTTKRPNTKNQKPTPKKAQQKKQSRLDFAQDGQEQEEEEEEDLINEFRDLPSKFQQTLVPDLERISITSQKYINRANKEMAKGFKPYVGNKYAPTIASIVSFAFIVIPLLLVSLIFSKIKAYFSLQKVLIFIQVYLSIYFSILCLSSLLTGLEPLRFFYSSAQSTYVCVMVMQTLGYVLFLLLLLMYLVLVFSTDCGLGSRMLGLGQTIVGFAVGLHYYVAVFHRVVLHLSPKTNWKVHGIYATCFLLVCLCASVADRRKKAYLEDGGEEGKKN